jgi:hypothetical protein
MGTNRAITGARPDITVNRRRLADKGWPSGTVPSFGALVASPDLPNDSRRVGALPRQETGDSKSFTLEHMRRYAAEAWGRRSCIIEGEAVCCDDNVRHHLFRGGCSVVESPSLADLV